MKANTPAERLVNGIIKENPTFVLVLGMCPTLAVTTSAINGIGMGLTTTVVLAMSNLMISLLRKFIPPIAALGRGEQGTDQFRDSQHQRTENGCYRKAVAFIGYHGSQVRTVVGQAENNGDQRYILVPGVEHRQAQRAQGCQQRQLAQNVPRGLHGRIFQSVPKAGLFEQHSCGLPSRRRP